MIPFIPESRSRSKHLPIPRRVLEHARRNGALAFDVGLPRPPWVKIYRTIRGSQQSKRKRMLLAWLEGYDAAALEASTNNQ